MIQRIQTIWLLLAAACGFLYTQVPLFTATMSDSVEKNFLTKESLILFAFDICVTLLAVVAIFLFKNRPLQTRLTIFGILGSLGLIALEVWQLQKFQTDNPLFKGTYAWGSLIPILMTVFFILALINIRKDQKLVKSLDRLR